MQDRKEAAVQVRTAGPPDAAELAQVQLEAALTGFAHIFPDAVPKPKLAAIEVDWAQLIADAGKTVLAATRNGRVVAGVAFGDFAALAPAGWGHLAKLYVHPAQARRGIGSKLHDIAVAQLTTAGYDKLWLWVLEGNVVARRIYERRGWVAQEERRTDWPGSGVFEMGYALESGYSSLM